MATKKFLKLQLLVSHKNPLPTCQSIGYFFNGPIHLIVEPKYMHSNCMKLGFIKKFEFLKYFE